MRGLDMTEADIEAEVGVPDRGGTPNDLMVKFSNKHLSPSSSGEHSFEGSIAIANIITPRGLGHYVVVLKIADDIVYYYCPYYGRVVSCSEGDLNWESFCGLTNWSVNFKDLNFLADPYDVKPERFVHIIVNPIETLRKDMDCSLFLYNRYRDRGYTVFLHEPHNISMRGHDLILSGIPPGENDVIWNRLDEVNTVEYYEKLRLMANTSSRMINSPATILLRHGKLITMPFIDESRVHNIHAFSCWDDLEWRSSHLLRKYGRVVIKAPSLCGGAGVEFADSMEGLKSSYDRLIKESGYVLVVPFYRDGIIGGNVTDRRIVLTQNSILCSNDRIAENEDRKCNSHDGARCELVEEVTPEQERICRRIQEYMSEEDIFIAGVDFLGSFVSEINITCVGGFFWPGFSEEENLRVVDRLIDEADEYFPDFV